MTIEKFGNGGEEESKGFEQAIVDMDNLIEKLKKSTDPDTVETVKTLVYLSKFFKNEVSSKAPVHHADKKVPPFGTILDGGFTVGEPEK